MGVDVASTLWFCFCGSTHECMSSVFNMLFLFWLVVMCLLSSLDKINVRAKLLADHVWEVEDGKTGFLSVGVGIFYWLFVKKRSMFCPWWKIVIKIENMINEDKWKISTNRNMWKIDFNECSKICFYETLL